MRFQEWWSGLAVAAMVVMASGAAASPACFTSAEIEAAEAVRFHTELMVGSLACRTLLDGTDSYERYKSFTRKHEAMLAGHERTLINRFARLDGTASALPHFDLYRTELANDLGKAVSGRIETYCTGHKALMDSWEPLDDRMLATYIQRRRHMEAARYPSCP